MGDGPGPPRNPGKIPKIKVSGISVKDHLQVREKKLRNHRKLYGYNELPCEEENSRKTNGV